MRSAKGEPFDPGGPVFPLVGAAAVGGPHFFVPPAKAPAAMIPFAFATIPPGGAFDFLAPGGGPPVGSPAVNSPAAGGPAVVAGGPPFFVPPAKAPAAMIPFAFATIPPGGAFDFLAPGGGPAKATAAITPFAFAAFAGALNAGAGPPGGGPPVGGPTFAVGGGDFFTAGTAPVPVGGGALFSAGAAAASSSMSSLKEPTRTQERKPANEKSENSKKTKQTQARSRAPAHQQASLTGPFLQGVPTRLHRKFR